MESKHGGGDNGKKRRPKALELEDPESPKKSEDDYNMMSPVPTMSSSSGAATARQPYNNNTHKADMKTFELEHVLKFHPPGAWQSKFGPRDGIPYEYHISTSFIKPGFTISCPGGVDLINIVCYGILSFKVLYSKEGDDDKAFGSGVVLSEIAVPPAVNGQRQRVEVKTPYPAMKVEAVVDLQSDDFVAIFGVKAYSSSRPSSLSTPINEGKSRGEAQPPWGKGMHGINPRML